MDTAKLQNRLTEKQKVSANRLRQEKQGKHIEEIKANLLVYEYQD